MEYRIRKIDKQEYNLLNDFLFEAIFIPEGMEKPDKKIIEKPELQIYVADFGEKKDDLCYVAEANHRVVGAVWVRDMNDYGHVEDGVPSFAISLYQEYRGNGIGTELMKTMLRELKNRGCKKASLSVQKNNYAVKMYKKLGFKIIDEYDEEYLMVINLDHDLKIDLNQRFEFRNILPQEADQTVSIELICFPPHEACSEKMMKERVAMVPDLFLVAVDKETAKIAGFLNGIATNEDSFRDEFFSDARLHDPAGKNVMLLGLDVLPEYRGQGLAKEIMFRYLHREGERGRKMVTLTCLPSKIKMYEKMGYQNKGISASTWGGEQWYEMSHMMNFD